MTFQNNFYNPDGSFYSPKVSDMYIPETLGYTYGLAPPPAAAAPAIVALGDKIKTLFVNLKSFSRKAGPSWRACSGSFGPVPEGSSLIS